MGAGAGSTRRGAGWRSPLPAHPPGRQAGSLDCLGAEGQWPSRLSQQTGTVSFPESLRPRLGDSDPEGGPGGVGKLHCHYHKVCASCSVHTILFYPHSSTKR